MKKNLLDRMKNKLRSSYILWKYRDHEILGHLSHLEGAELSHIVKTHKSDVILEIGSFLGRSTNFICNSKNDSDVLYCIDTWMNDAMSEGGRDTFQTFNENTIHLNGLKKLKGYSREFKDSIENNSVDILFVDADHSYEGCKEDIINFIGKVRKNGVVVFHDYMNPCGVKDAVDELVKKKCKRFYISGSMFIGVL